MIWLCVVFAALGAAESSAEEVLVDFSQESLPGFVQFNNTIPGERTSKTGIVTSNEGDVPVSRFAGLEIVFSHSDWPNVLLKAPEGGWDWSAYDGVGFTVFNPTDVAVSVAMRLDNEGANGMDFCNNLRSTVRPGSRLDFNMLFNRAGDKKLWGMRGTPGAAQYGEGKPLDLARITAVQLFLPMPDRENRLIFEKASLIKLDGDSGAGVRFPFVNKFGQYIHDEWPGKLHSEEEFAERVERERFAWGRMPQLPDRDRFGGWANGPRRKATGWFRTEEINGKWWLITPEGTLFLSLGITCIGTWERTFVEGRKDWFEWLPPEDDPQFGGLYSHMKGAHSMADPIGGEGKAFGFYSVNLIRKYGAQWAEQWRESVYPRLRHWGFNTIANWSQEDVLMNSDLPFVASTGLSKVRLIESARGYWRKMMDVYDVSFTENVAATIKYIAAKYGENPLCIGYYVDNELAWEGVIEGVLSSAAEQPARQALLAFLQKRYETLDALNTAWGVSVDSWDAINNASAVNETAKKDMSDFLYEFARQYFSVIQSAIDEHAPNQLYLGCRFASAPDEAVRACADVADVVSCNLYYSSIPPDKYAGTNSLGKPVMIGEFHFGALDRGMFHTGLVGAKDQADRAAQYKRYVRSVADNPSFVGCHWFQYIDEPITGRWFDGENYNIGFVDVTDTPYPEMVEAAQEVHAEIYTRRYGRKNNR